MLTGKYIVGTSPVFESRLEQAIVFSEVITHRKMAEALNMTVRSAGQVRVIDGEVHAFGESTTLRVKSLADDVRLLKQALGHENSSEQSYG